ncbi:glycine-rich cell wall structural protein 2-like [Lycium barbarum]|uniref:glycine-rich cell wall structural protein 2-like n=1 Tax=Lycium barbarum TaxID=112863 RepID=UPI00293E15F9|nr:glycine-rich cell wall structural protein 2-like [Lycium barbarum]
MASLFSCFCGRGFEGDRSLRRDWSFPHSPPLDPDLSDVEEDDEYYIYPQKSATKIGSMVALGGSTTSAATVYTNDDDGGGSGYSSDHYGNGWNDGEKTPTLTGVYSDGGYKYADGEYGGGDASDNGGEEGGGDGNYSGDGGSNYGSGGYESA